MEKIVLRFMNHARMKVETSQGVERELYDHFSFYVPNYKFTPLFKKKLWDGQIHLFDSRQKTLPRGLINDLIQFSTLDGRDYLIQMDQALIDDINQEKIDPNFFSTIEYTSNGKSIHPMDYQLNAVQFALENKRALIKSPTGSGKSLIIYSIIRYILDKSLVDYDQKILIVVPSTSLVEQMFKDFWDYSENDYAFSASNTCQRLYSGVKQDQQSITDPRIVISTWQSIHRKETKWFSQFGAVIGDEVHVFKAKSLNTIMMNLQNAKYRIGTTGTLDGTETNLMTIKGLFGEIYEAATTKELMDKNILSQLHINILALLYPKCTIVNDKLNPLTPKQKYDKEIETIISHEKRTSFVCKLALDKKDENTLILFNFVAKHGKPIFKKLLEMNADSERKILYISGETSVEDREKARHIAETENGVIIVASYGTYQQGINIKNLQNIIFAAPSKSQVRVLQSIGRALRISGDKNYANLYDVIDILSGDTRKKNNLYRHGIERMNMYVKEQCKYKIFEIPIS